ncbi:hypothetical protein WI91_16280 [Burkholderia vietnamiensis]|nr:hypothetical protein WK31_09875 [Burkholderia vietnamiensis]AOK41334.1 hypothetical protein WL96_09935 [Burkholderia vietnamiensis]KVE03448.1 hypothetical protein WI91_16280 [Burkholderia vietnamiensis]KVF36391.1 hypothetical protein WJ09_07495 [Burkholderia vietnamiensis]KVR68770.1 hypothetical protein WK24_01440 [Burkholderia vietnamiensis]
MELATVPSRKPPRHWTSLHKPLSGHRQQQSFSADAETGSLPIGAATNHLLLCAEFGTAHFEAPTVQIVAEASAGRIIGFIAKAE